MAKKRAITKAEVAGVVARRKRGMSIADIEEEVQLGGDAVMVILTASGMSKTTAASRRKYRAVLDRWLAANGNGTEPKPRPKRKRAKAKAAS